MSVNLMGLLQDQLSGGVMSKLSGFLGESQDNTKKGMMAALPSVIGGLMNKGATQEGAEGIMSMIKDGGHDGSMFDNLEGLVGGGDATDKMMSSGKGIMDNLFGDKLGSVVNSVSSTSGLAADKASSLLGMAGPMVLGMLGKQTAAKGLGASGLMSMLGSQGGFIKKFLPSGLGSVLGLASLGKVTEAVSGTVKNVGKTTAAAGGKVVDTAASTAAAGGSFLRWLLPLLLVAALIAAALYFVRGCGGTGINTIDNAADKIGQTVDNAKDKVVETTNNVIKKLSFKLPSGESVEFAEGSFGDSFVKYLQGGKAEANKRFTFDNLTFAVGSANLTEESAAIVGDIAKVMKGYPKVNIKLEGHTDNTGDAAKNKTLSLARATSVVNSLVGAGIDAKRLAAEGLGQDKPTASNDTEEGKKQNRRIEVVVTAQ